jgi:hypothetical protein
VPHIHSHEHPTAKQVTAANGGIASLLQSVRIVAAVAELGSLGHITRMETIWRFAKAMIVVLAVPLALIAIYLIGIFLPMYLLTRFMGD